MYRVHVGAQDQERVCAPARCAADIQWDHIRTSHGPTVDRHGARGSHAAALSRVGHRPPGAVTVGALTNSYSRLQRAGAATIQFPNIAVTVGLGPYKHEK